MRVRYSFSSRKTRTLDMHNQHRTEFPKIALEIIDRSDILLEILDARFIEKTRNAVLENLIKEKKKVLLYVVNKSDFSDISKIKKEIQASSVYPAILVSCKDRRGGKELRTKIKIEAKKLGKPRVYVGVLGMPNTGKSSIINLLIGKASAKAAPESGFTKGVQKLKLSEGIFILDTPGVIPDSRYSMTDSNTMAKNALLSTRSYEKIKEPEITVDLLMKENPQLLEKFYNIEANGNSEILIEELGRKKHFLKKGNQVDADRTARFILRDWQEGRVRLADRKDDEQSKS